MNSDIYYNLDILLTSVRWPKVGLAVWSISCLVTGSNSRGKAKKIFRIPSKVIKNKQKVEKLLIFINILIWKTKLNFP